MRARLAARNERVEFPALEQDGLPVQPAIPLDPRSDICRIGGVHRLGYLARAELSPLVIDEVGGMKAEDRPRGDTDALARHAAQHERAGREARTVDDDALARLPDLGEEVEILADGTASAREDADIGKRRPRPPQSESQRERKPHGRRPASGDQGKAIRRSLVHSVPPTTNRVRSQSITSNRPEVRPSGRRTPWQPGLPGSKTRALGKRTQPPARSAL